MPQEHAWGSCGQEAEPTMGDLIELMVDAGQYMADCWLING